MKHPEHDLHKAVATYLTIVLDPLVTFWTSIDHGMHLAGDAKARARKIARMRAVGVKFGFPDVLIIHESRAYLIELKSEDGVLTGNQEEVNTGLSRAGSSPRICRSVDEVEGVLAAWEIPRKGRLAA